MTQDKTSSNGGHGPSIELAECSIVVLVTENNPSILNPDFLQYNEIVGPDWQVQDFSISPPTSAQVAFEGGLTVKADLQRVIFEQLGGGLVIPEGGLVIPEVAKRYFQQVPYIPYSGIGINPKFFLRLTGEHPPLMENIVRDQGAWMSFKDVAPTVQLKSIYRYEERTISLDVAHIEPTIDDQPSSGILFQANVHHEVDGPNAQVRNKQLQSILDSWEDDLEDVRQLSTILLGGMK